MPTAYAILSNTEITADKAVRLLPLGEFAATDGRPGSLKDVTCKTWRLTKERAADIVTAFASRKNQLLFDYEHATLFKKGTGEIVPASGWGAALVVRDDGLYAEPVEWTPRAAAMIESKEYRYTSPVFTFDRATGDVVDVTMCAITNDPALDGLAELQVALSALTATTTKDANMDKIIERLQWMLNLPISATAEDIVAELDKLKGQLTEVEQAAASFDLLAYLAKGSAAQTRVAALSTEIVALKAATEPDPAAYVPIAMYNAAATKVTSLTTKIS
jgi:phage I-like protein